MSKVQMLRCLVNERLTAAAEEIFALFERTIAEYEEEVCRSKEENTRKQQLLDSVVGPRVLLHRAGDQLHLSLNQEITETPQIKEEPEAQSIKQEEDQLQEFTSVSVKSEEQSSLLQQRQSEHREETQGEECEGAEADLNPHGLLHSETEQHTDNDEDWEPPASSSTQQMESEADGDHYNQVTSFQNSNPISHFKSSPETSDTVKDWDTSGSHVGVKMKKHECSVCKKRFSKLQRHTRVHTGEKPYSCSICKKAFAQTNNLKEHMVTHTGEKPYSCSICKKTFAYSSVLKKHMRTHTGEKPYSCTICKKKMAHNYNLKLHMKTHTGEILYSCPICKKKFARNYNLKLHMNTHTGEKPYSCTVCKKTFTYKCNFNKHMTAHTGERP